MIYLIFLVFIIILIFLLFDKYNESFSAFTNRTFFNQNQPIEITKLPVCNKIFKIEYTLNTSTVNNDNKSISFDIIEPMIQTAEIGGVIYNLSKIEWKMSPFSWKSKQVGIDLYLTHTNYKSMTSMIIVIPLDLLSESIIANSSEAVNLPLSSSNNPIDSSELNNPINSSELNNPINSSEINNPIDSSEINNQINSSEINNQINSSESSINVPSSNSIKSNDIIDLSDTTHFIEPTQILDLDDSIETIDIVEDFKDVYYNKMDESLSMVANINGVDENTYSIVTNEIDKTKYFNLDHTLADIRNSFGDIDTSNGNTINDIDKFNLQLQYSRNYDINKYSINKLLNNFTQIPNYQCCSIVIGPLIGINLCPLKKIIESNPQFYILEQENGNVILITQPSPFNETIGLYIRDSVKQDTDIKYLIPNKK